MAYTVQNVADLARSQMNDDAKTRASDAKLEFWFNAGLGALALLRPDLFTVFGAVTPTPDQCYQDLVVVVDQDALALQNIMAVQGGAVVLECEYRAHVATNPSAFTDASSTPVNWARDPMDADAQSATRFYLFPRPVTGTVLLTQYAKAPAYKALADVVPLPAAYRPALASYLKYAFEMVDDDYVVNQRAQQELAAFMATVGTGQKTKKVSPDK